MSAQDEQIQSKIDKFFSNFEDDDADDDADAN